MAEPNMLKDYQHVFVAVILVAVLILLYNEMKKAGKELRSPLEGYVAQSHATGGNLALRVGSIRDDTGSYDKRKGNVRAESDANNAQELFGNAMEPPVFWNAGSYAAVNKSQAGGSGVDAADWDESLESMSGGYVERLAPKVADEALNPY